MLINLFLFPFALLYDLVTRIRNVLYDKEIFQSNTFPVFIVSVGNLTVGGTGKTPHVEYLIRFFTNLLQEKSLDKQQVAFLSRGYGRKTKGVIIANQQANSFVSAATIGDEPQQIFDKFSTQITVAVGEKRALAIPQICKYAPQTKVIVLDDAYQHRAVNRDVNILLTDYYRPFYKDFLLPTGRLRESRKGAKRANAIIVTKCPENLQSIEKEGIKKEIKKYSTSDTPIFFTTFRYAQPLSLLENEKMLNPNTKNLILVTGIADTTSLIIHLKKQYHISKHFQFADHYEYTEDAVNQIISEYRALKLKQDCFILTTEKDKAKLLIFKDLWKDISFFYLPIEVYFLEDEAIFLQQIADFLPPIK